MRQSNNGRRTRGGRPTRRPGPLKSQTFDSNGPDVRIRGNAHQVLEKYQNLARDAHTNGDRVLAESYYQFAEHYYRIVHDSTDPESPGSQRSAQRQQNDERDDGQRDDGQGDDNDETQQSDSGSSRRRDYSRQRQPVEARDPDEMAAEGESQHVNGDAQEGDDREGLERTLGSKPVVVADEAGAEEGEAAGEQDEDGKSSRSNGQRSTRSRSRYRRSSSSRSSGKSEDDEAAAPQRRQFPMPAESSEPAEGGESPEG